MYPRLRFFPYAIRFFAYGTVQLMIFNIKDG